MASVLSLAGFHHRQLYLLIYPNTQWSQLLLSSGALRNILFPHLQIHGHLLTPSTSAPSRDSCPPHLRQAQRCSISFNSPRAKYWGTSCHMFQELGLIISAYTHSDLCDRHLIQNSAMLTCLLFIIAQVSRLESINSDSCYPYIHKIINSVFPDLVYKSYKILSASL